MRQLEIPPSSLRPSPYAEELLCILSRAILANHNLVKLSPIDPFYQPCIQDMELLRLEYERIVALSSKKEDVIFETHSELVDTSICELETSLPQILGGYSDEIISIAWNIVLNHLRNDLATLLDAIFVPHKELFKAHTDTETEFEHDIFQSYIKCHNAEFFLPLYKYLLGPVDGEPFIQCKNPFSIAFSQIFESELSEPHDHSKQIAAIHCIQYEFMTIFKKKYEIKYPIQILEDT